MSYGAWSFRTTRGVVTVGADAITRRSTPTLFLSGQFARFRNGGTSERATVAFRAFGFIFSVAGAVYHLRGVTVAEPGWSSILYGALLAVLAYAFWAACLRETTIPQSAIVDVTVTPDERQVTITHERAGGPMSMFRDDETETELAFGTLDDLRDAREIFRLRGISLERPASRSETTYRFVTKGGVCFCERCRSQVSPSDGTCPACGYALRVEAAEEA